MSQHTYKQNISRLMALLLALTLVLACVPMAQAVESGSCGDNLTWSFDGSTLTISGSGLMTNYSETNMPPWYSHREEILNLSLPEGLTRIGELAFYDCVNLRSVNIPGSVEIIGEAAFYRNSAMTMLTLNSGLRSIGRNAFYQCESLQDLRLPNSLLSIGNHAFYMCSSLTAVSVPASVSRFGSGVFSYCTNLMEAEIDASVSLLPGWTFYGCDKLTVVTVNGSNVSADTLKVSDIPQSSEGSTPEAWAPEITEPAIPGMTPVPTEPPVPAAPAVPETPAVPDPTVPVENSSVNKTENSTTTKVTVTETDPNTSDQSTKVDISSTIVNDEGWQEVVNQVVGAERGGVDVNADIYLPGSDMVPEDVLEPLIGKNVTLNIHTQSGAQFILDCTKLDKKQINKDLDLSYTLTIAEDVPENMTGCTVYRLNFHNSAVIRAEVVIRLPGDHSYQTASLYEVKKKEPNHVQSVMVDPSGSAHWYLRSVDKKTDYLIGINIPGAVEDTPIIPAELHDVYKVANVFDGVEYVVTGRNSSWNMGLGKVMAILAVVMIAAVGVIGAVMFFWNKQRLKNGYVPQWDDEDE